MFRTIARAFLPNPFDWMLKKTARRGGKRILLGWNRGLGDIALGLFAMVERIRALIPDAEITFMTRENLREGFSLLEGVQTVIAPDWKRGVKYSISPLIKKEYDLVIEQPSPTDWVYWQRGKVVPKLKWNPDCDKLSEKFGLSPNHVYVGVQIAAETNYGLWRNWPLERWKELFSRLKGVQFLLFGFGEEPWVTEENVIDLRGKTSLFELLSLIKNRCYGLVLPDSGISSMVYYLDVPFVIRHVTLWADPNHGILKQNVPSPNPLLKHLPLVGKNRDLSTVSVDAVIESLFPVQNVGAILLAAGLGSRLGIKGPKGLFTVAGKTLFEWICGAFPKHLPLAIMTSQQNHEETVSYFKRHHFFGLELYFFQQEEISVLEDERLKAPKGNGNVFRAFTRAGLADLFAKKGIDLVTVSYVDNPFVKMADPALIYAARKNDVTIQCIRKEEADQSMGVIVEEGERMKVIEYTERDPSKEYAFAYSGQMAFSLSFFREMAHVDLPLHWVKKKMGNQVVTKGEQFIFDVLPFAKRIGRFEVAKKSHFGPIKTLEQVEEVERRLREKL